MTTPLLSQDVIALSKADCASPVTYYKSMLITLAGFKGIVLGFLTAVWLFTTLRQRILLGTLPGFRWLTVWLREQRQRRREAGLEVVATPVPRGRQRRGSVMQEMKSVNWAGVFRAMFMLLFVAYPSVSLKVFRVFKCVRVEGVWYMAADMRLRCFTGRWYTYATYASVMGAVYVFGFPLAITIILVRRRRTLFGDGSADTMRVYGFLYDAYGPNAWWWEVEELMRKLLLTAVVVFFDNGSPLQVTVAVMISGWAHVLHAVYKPWGVGSRTYVVQHGSLLVTTFVVLMGLLFKVDGVSKDSPSYQFMSLLMLLLCVGFAFWWVMEMFGGVVVTLRRRQEKAAAAAAAEELKARESLLASNVFGSAIDAPSSPSSVPLLPPPSDASTVATPAVDVGQVLGAVRVRRQESKAHVFDATESTEPAVTAAVVVTARSRRQTLDDDADIRATLNPLRAARASIADLAASDAALSGARRQLEESGVSTVTNPLWSRRRTDGPSDSSAAVAGTAAGSGAALPSYKAMMKHRRTVTDSVTATIAAMDSARGRSGRVAVVMTQPRAVQGAVIKSPDTA